MDPGRPAGFIAAMQKLAAGNGAVPHLPSIERWRKGDKAKAYDPNLDGTRQEKRSFVCGQCHVEYFCGKGTTIFFPWAEGLIVETPRTSTTTSRTPRATASRTGSTPRPASTS
jgi:hypothetical protein